MPGIVYNTDQCQCSFGVSPCPLVVTPEIMCLAGNQPAATIMDFVPGKNLASFGMCNSLANPATASATSAAMGVLTPTPCVPVTAAPWVPGVPTVLVSNKPALNISSKLMCSYGGVIMIITPGCPTVMVP